MLYAYDNGSNIIDVEDDFVLHCIYGQDDVQYITVEMRTVICSVIFMCAAAKQLYYFVNVHEYGL